MYLPIWIPLSQQKHDLLTREIRLLEPRLCPVDILKHITLLELSFKCLDYFRTNLPILIPDDAISNCRFLDANVRDYGNSFVIASEITERRPLVVILRRDTHGQHQKNDQNF